MLQFSANKGNQKDITTKCNVVLEFIWGTTQKLMHSFLTSNYWEMTDLNRPLCDILLSGGRGTHYMETGRPCHLPYLLIYRPKAEMIYSIISSSLWCPVMCLKWLGMMITGWRDCISKLFGFVSQLAEVFVIVAWKWLPSWGSELGTRTEKEHRF